VLTLIGSGRYLAPDGTLFGSGSTLISLSATDPALDDGTPGSGAMLFTSTDGGPASPYVAPFSLQGLADGAHAVVYWSIDRAGNREASHTQSLVLDTRPPSVSPIVTGTLNADGSYSSAVRVALPAGDSGSGLRCVGYLLAPDPQPIPTCANRADGYTPGQEIMLDATTWLGYIAQDNVGNAYVGSLTITVTTPAATPPPGVTTAPRPTATYRPSVTPTPTRAMHPAPSPTSAVTHTPRPTPTWHPIDGPPILKRQLPESIQPTVVAGPGAVHIHLMPPRRATRTPTSRCTKSHGCTKPSNMK
jgi:hypothetical protein